MTAAVSVPGRDDSGGMLDPVDESWPLRLDICPCDADFVRFLVERRIAGKAVFHFGTGEHHLVGIENARTRRPNHVLGVTASRREHARYIDLVVADPLLANSYKVVFVDIYALDRRGLPDFDVVALFHLCEFYDPERSGQVPLDDRGVLNLFLGTLKPGGRICFYLGSNGRDAMLRMVDSFVATGKLAIVEQFRSLLICAAPRRKPGKDARASDRAFVKALLDA